MKSTMKMFRNKDRRKIMRHRSSGEGTDQPTTGAAADANSKPTASPSPITGIPAPIPPRDNPVAQVQEKAPPKQAPPPQQQAQIDHATAMAAAVQTQPVLARRSTLHRTTASISSYRATPITKHYSLNNQILGAFESHYDSKLYTVAYAIGLQFVETALLEIPKHGYFYSTRHTQERLGNSLNAIRVSNMLQTILMEQLDSGNTGPDLLGGGVDLQQELIKVQKLHQLALELQEHVEGESGSIDPDSINQYEAQRAAVEMELNEMKKQEAPLVETCGQFLDCSFSELCPPSFGGYSNLNNSPQATTLDPPAYASLDTDRQQEQAPPKAIPPPPPQYERTMSSMMREMMQQPKPPDILNLPPGVQVAIPVANTVPRRQQQRPMDPPALHPTMSAVARASVTGPLSSSISGGAPPPPPPLEGGGWMVMPDLMPERPSFGRQMSGRSYADHVALERALYLSGLEVQPEMAGDDDPYNNNYSTAAIANHHHPGNNYDRNPLGAQPLPQEDDEQWMLEHALKESEREMEALREKEELELLEACQQSKKQQMYQSREALPQHLLQMDPSSSSVAGTPPAPALQRRMTKSRLQIETLHTLYQEDFVHLWNSGRIRITHVDTYQGKNPGSTNGCTVIAPLLCIHHFINFTEPDFSGRPVDDPGLPDETIKSVIDQEVPTILPSVREELGVVQDAFLIPSDAHDYLLKNQLLSQEQFVTVIGGNILDERHLNELIRTLVEGCLPANPCTSQEDNDASGTTASVATMNGTIASPMDAKGESNGSNTKPGSVAVNPSSSDEKKRDMKNAKIACTLFFHEHVVSILKLGRARDGRPWFDIIDSLPSRQMLNRKIGAENKNPSNLKDDTNGEGPVDEFGISLSEFEPPMNTARIRCLDEESLSVALRWYACAKFNSENLNYIDAYPWDDNSTDFDPRVFQAFVWAEAA